MVEKPYNPLDRRNLARSVEVTLLQREALPMPLIRSFQGAGLYAIYYTGDFEPYRPIASLDCEIPIYVGKADPPGGRRGLVRDSAPTEPVLWKRIDDHSKSIQWADNLAIGDFRVRYLVVEDIFIGMGEQLLIQQFRPLWNGHVSGFGLHDPGQRRYGGNRSEWDELHPGRPWHPYMRQATSAERVIAKIERAFAIGQAASLAGTAATSPPVAGIQTSLPEAPEVDDA